MEQIGNKTDPELIQTMRELREKGENSVYILRMLSNQGIGTIGLINHFREAFGLRLVHVTCIGGWQPDGKGELNDEQINELLEWAMQNK